VPTFVDSVKAYRDRDDWDAALTAHVAEHKPDLVVSAGFLKLVGARVPGRVRRPLLNTHNALLPSFPGIHGPRDALAYGVKVAGATLLLRRRRASTPARSSPRSACPVLDDDTERRCPSASRWPTPASWSSRSAGLVRDGWTIEDRKVRNS
jgi:phosphoribosylglycinamide formyltransferase-1